MNLKILIALFLFLNIGNVFAITGISNDLRRYSDSEEAAIKVKIESKNKKAYETREVKQSATSEKSPKKMSSKNYKGHYKVGNPYTVLGQTFYPKEVTSYQTTGMASWYGADFHNKKTSNGETYDMHDFTAAHPTLQLPCIVKVTNLENGKSIKVRVNDRGPFTKKRVIDVSRAAAIELGFFQQGTTKVKVEYMPKESAELLRQCGLR